MPEVRSFSLRQGLRKQKLPLRAENGGHPRGTGSESRRPDLYGKRLRADHGKSLLDKNQQTQRRMRCRRAGNFSQPQNPLQSAGRQTLAECRDAASTSGARVSDEPKTRSAGSVETVARGCHSALSSAGSFFASSAAPASLQSLTRKDFLLQFASVQRSEPVLPPPLA